MQQPHLDIIVLASSGNTEKLLFLDFQRLLGALEPFKPIIELELLGFTIANTSPKRPVDCGSQMGNEKAMHAASTAHFLICPNL